MITIQESGDADAKDPSGNATPPKTRSWVFDDGAFAGFANLDPSYTADLTPEERERIAKQVERRQGDRRLQARAASSAGHGGRVASGPKKVANARKKGRKIAEQARAQAREQTERMRAELDQNMKAWRTPGTPDANGKVLMRCSVKPDGSPSDCEKVTSRVMIMPNPPRPPALPPLPALGRLLPPPPPPPAALHLS